MVSSGTIHTGDNAAGQSQATAYNDATGWPFTADLTGQDLGGLTLTSGVYFFSSSAQLTETLTLNAQGDPDAVFVFQIGSTLTTASDSNVSLINGAQFCQIFWKVGSSATLGTYSHFVGHILALTSITANTGATVQGQLLAQNGAITLDTNTITNGIDAVAPVVTLGEINTTPTNQDITVTATTDEGALIADSHVFTANGSFVFVATDAAENVTTKTVTISTIDKVVISTIDKVTISTIDKVAPVVTLGEINTAPTNQDISITTTIDESGQLPKTATSWKNVLVLIAGIAARIGIKSATIIAAGVLIGGFISNIPIISEGAVQTQGIEDVASEGLEEPLGTITQNNPDGSITKVLPDGTIFTKDAEGIGKLTSPDGNLTKTYPDDV